MDHRERYLEYQLLTQQLQKVQEYLEGATDSIAEVEKTMRSLDELGTLGKGDRVFAPIANGIFIDARLNDPATVRMNVGGKTMAAKTIAEAKGLLGRQRDELRQLRDHAQADNLKFSQRLKEIERDLEAEERDGEEGEKAE